MAGDTVRRHRIRPLTMDELRSYYRKRYPELPDESIEKMARADYNYQMVTIDELNDVVSKQS